MAFEGEHRIELTKDIIAMSNTRDGGTIVIGVSEDREGGKWRFDGLTPEQCRTFDVTKVHDYVKQRAAPPVRVTSQTIEQDGKLFVVLQIPEFEEQPVVCTKMGQLADGKTLFHPGDLLWRTPGAQSEKISDEAGVRQLLGMALQRRADMILGDMSRLLKGAPASGPIASDIWQDCRSLASVYSPRQGKYASVGMWSFILHPDDQLSPPAGAAFEALRKIARDATVSMRGWDFPHLESEATNRSDAKTGLSYLQSSTDWSDRVEATMLFQNGFFQHDRLMDEDLEAQNDWGIENPKPPGEFLDWLSTVYIMGEFAVFASRLYQLFEFDGRVNYEIWARGTAGRVLFTRSFEYRSPRTPRKCAEPDIRISGAIDAIALRADPGGLATESAKRIFSLFHWENPSEAMLRGVLEKLFTRRL